MIIGVTHDPDGRVVQRLSVSTKVSIGLPPNGDRNHPTKLDHFVFLRKKKSANRLRWEADPELTRHYGEQCRELHIMLIDDDIENAFPSSYAWWTAIERKQSIQATGRSWAWIPPRSRFMESKSRALATATSSPPATTHSCRSTPSVTVWRPICGLYLNHWVRSRPYVLKNNAGMSAWLFVSGCRTSVASTIFTLRSLRWS